MFMSSFGIQIKEHDTANSSTEVAAANIIMNGDFSMGLHAWHPNCCYSYVVTAAESNNMDGPSTGSVVNHAVVTNRTECWQGLEQDVTSYLSPGLTYLVSACVGVSGPLQGSADVLATLKLEYQDSATNYLCIGK